ncbi:1-acylglycerol-3-phosphate O-acyltransferase [Cryptotrichosporon argae]
MFLASALKPLALVSTLALSALGVLGQKYQRARFAFHLSLYITTLGALSVWGVLVSVLASVAGQRLNINYYVARSFYYVCHPLVGIPFDVEGEEHLQSLLVARDGKPQSAVLIGNHQSFLDILYLGRIFPKRAAIMAKQELKWAPLLGQYMSLSGAVFVNRKNRKDAVRTVEKAGEDMKKKGISLWIFPEGTRSLTSESTLLPFKKGAFHLAVQAQVPIVAVVCENYHRLFDGRSRMERGRLRIRVLPPISTHGLTADDVHALCESTRALMLDALADMSAPGAAKRHAELPAATSELARAQAGEDGDALATAVEARAQPDLVDGEARARRPAHGGEAETTDDEMDDDAVLLKRPGA